MANVKVGAPSFWGRISSSLKRKQAADPSYQGTATEPPEEFMVKQREKQMRKEARAAAHAQLEKGLMSQAEAAAQVEAEKARKAGAAAIAAATKSSKGAVASATAIVKKYEEAGYDIGKKSVRVEREVGGKIVREHVSVAELKKEVQDYGKLKVAERARLEAEIQSYLQTAPREAVARAKESEDYGKALEFWTEKKFETAKGFGTKLVPAGAGPKPGLRDILGQKLAGIVHKVTGPITQETMPGSDVLEWKGAQEPWKRKAYETHVELSKGVAAAAVKGLSYGLLYPSFEPTTPHEAQIRVAGEVGAMFVTGLATEKAISWISAKTAAPQKVFIEELRFVEQSDDFGDIIGYRKGRVTGGGDIFGRPAPVHFKAQFYGGYKASPFEVAVGWGTGPGKVEFAGGGKVYLSRLASGEFIPSVTGYSGVAEVTENIRMVSQDFGARSWIKGARVPFTAERKAREIVFSLGQPPAGIEVGFEAFSFSTPKMEAVTLAKYAKFGGTSKFSEVYGFATTGDDVQIFFKSADVSFMRSGKQVITTPQFMQTGVLVGDIFIPSGIKLPGVALPGSPTELKVMEAIAGSRASRRAAADLLFGAGQAVRLDASLKVGAVSAVSFDIAADVAKAAKDIFISSRAEAGLLIGTAAGTAAESTRLGGFKVTPVPATFGGRIVMDDYRIVAPRAGTKAHLQFLYVGGAKGVASFIRAGRVADVSRFVEVKKPTDVGKIVGPVVSRKFGMGAVGAGRSTTALKRAAAQKKKSDVFVSGKPATDIISKLRSKLKPATVPASLSAQKVGMDELLGLDVGVGVARVTGLDIPGRVGSTPRIPPRGGFFKPRKGPSFRARKRKLSLVSSRKGRRALGRVTPRPDLLTKTLVESVTRKPAKALKATPKVRKAYARAFKRGGTRFPTAELMSGKVKIVPRGSLSLAMRELKAVSKRKNSGRSKGRRRKKVKFI